MKTALNTSTLLPFSLDVKEQIEVTAEAGYDGIELWLRDIEAYCSQGGSLKELRRIIQSAGIKVVNGIAFFPWADANSSKREEGLVQAKKEMGWLAELEATAVAAPPFGDVETVTLDEMGEYFAALHAVGVETGVEPYLEFWGRAKQLSRLSQALYVAQESGVAGAKILLDVFHMYTGGSRVEQLALMAGRSIGLVHVNDYPKQPDQSVITDQDRVFPGDGMAPTEALLETLQEVGYTGYLSLELFIQDYGRSTALEVAVEGLEKTKTAYSL